MPRVFYNRLDRQDDPRKRSRNLVLNNDDFQWMMPVDVKDYLERLDDDVVDVHVSVVELVNVSEDLVIHNCNNC